MFTFKIEAVLMHTRNYLKIIAAYLIICAFGLFETAQAQTQVAMVTTTGCGTITYTPGVTNQVYRVGDSGGRTWIIPACANKAFGFSYTNGIRYDWNNSTTNNIADYYEAGNKPTAREG